MARVRVEITVKLEKFSQRGGDSQMGLIIQEEIRRVQEGESNLIFSRNYSIFLFGRVKFDRRFELEVSSSRSGSACCCYLLCKFLNVR